MKKKILIFSMVYFPVKVGGAENAIKEITDRLSPDEFEFHMICNRYDSTFPKTEKIGNVIVHRIGLTIKEPEVSDLRKLPLHLNKLFYQWLAFWEAKKLHRKENFDGTWAMMAHSTGVPAGKFKKSFPEVKYVLTLQEGDPPEHIEQKMRMFGKSFDEAFTRADMIQVISNFLGDWAKQKGFKGSVVRIPNAVNIKHFSQTYTKEEIAEAKEELGLKASDIALVTTSRLVYKNGIDDVIKAIAHLPKNIKFVIFGNGPDEQKLKSLAGELGLTDRVIFYGFIDHQVMPKYLKACNIFIRPSRSEGMGNSFVEAMAAELPVIATQEGGIADFLFDGERNPERSPTGWAVDVDSPEQIAKAVEKIILDTEATNQIIETARNMAMAEYDWDLIATQMKEKVFNTVISRND